MNLINSVLIEGEVTEVVGEKDWAQLQIVGAHRLAGPYRINVMCYDRLASNVREYCSVGRSVRVVGYLSGSGNIGIRAEHIEFKKVVAKEAV